MTITNNKLRLANDLKRAILPKITSLNIRLGEITDEGEYIHLPIMTRGADAGECGYIAITEEDDGMNVVLTDYWLDSEDANVMWRPSCYTNGWKKREGGYMTYRQPDYDRSPTEFNKAVKQIVARLNKLCKNMRDCKTNERRVA